MIYYRINFLINYNIFIILFNINITDFIEYNLIIILIFFVYSILQLLCIIFKKEIKFKLLHYLSFPWLSLCFWIFLYANVTDLLVFESLYNDFEGYDDKYYEVAHVDFKSIDGVIISEKKLKN